MDKYIIVTRSTRTGKTSRGTIEFSLEQVLQLVRKMNADAAYLGFFTYSMELVKKEKEEE